jgi:cyclin-dependent kinase 8/11
MLDYNPATRVTADEALAHPYFTAEPRPAANAFAVQVGFTPFQTL